jgi:hypothetical protein
VSSRAVGVLYGGAATFVVAVLIVIAALLFGGCGGSDSPSTSFDQGQGQSPPGFGQAGAPTAVDPAALRRFSSCMKNQGIDIPSGPAPGSGPPSGSPPGGGQLFNSAKARRAMRACSQYLPQGGPPSGGFSAPTS